jgi:hypothetical protein
VTEVEADLATALLLLFMASLLPNLADIDIFIIYNYYLAYNNYYTLKWGFGVLGF